MGHSLILLFLLVEKNPKTIELMSNELSGDALLQVAQLRVENSSLLRRLADVNQKFNEAAVDNRVLKADVETLRAKVPCFVCAV